MRAQDKAEKDSKGEFNEMKRKLCIVLALIMLLSCVVVFSSCGNDANDGIASTTVTTIPEENGGDVDEEAKLYEDLPTERYDEFDFKTLTRVLSYASITTFVPEEGSQNTIDIALFKRNSYVKEILGINIVDTLSSNHSTVINSIVSSNDYEYDVIFDRADSMTGHSIAGAFFGIDEYDDSLNFDKPWWFKEATDDVSIDGLSFFTFGDINVGYYEAIYTLGFNKQHLIDNRQSMPYDLVREGKWTVEELEKLIKNVADGINCYGLTGHAMVPNVFMVGAGIEMVEQDEDEVLRIYDNEDHLVNVYTKLKDLFFASNGYGKTNYIDPTSGTVLSSHFYTDCPENADYRARFTSGLCAFYIINVGQFISEVRASEFDYGYLPIPKYEKEQERYISLLHGGSIALAIPITNPDMERTCNILENFGAYSYKMVRYEYYDVLLKGRAVRDPDSIEMLDICFGVDERGSTAFSLDLLYGFGLTNVVAFNMFDNVSSVMDKVEAAAGTAQGRMDDIIEAFK